MSAWLQTKSWEEAKEAIAESKGVAIPEFGSGFWLYPLRS